MKAQTSALDRVERALERFTRPVAFVGVVGMLVVACITVVDILLRWLVSGGITAMNEIVSMVFAVAVAACIPWGLARRVNLRIDIFARWFTGRIAGVLDAAGALLLLVFFALIAWQLFLYAQQLSSRHSTTILRGIPQAPFMYAAAVLLAAGALVQCVVALNAVVKACLPAQDEAGHRPSMRIRSATSIVAVATLALLAWGVADFAGFSRWTQANPALAVGLAFVLMWTCLLWMVPLAAVMGLLGIVGTALFIGFGPALSAIATEISGFMTNAQVATLPLFLMMGSFAAVAGVSDDIYSLAQALVGRFKAGLAYATIGGCAGFGAVTGSSLATVATFGRAALPEMRSRGYAPTFATGCVAAGGTLGALIPPSGPLVVYALLTESSIGALFIAAIVPGLIAVALYAATIWLQTRLTPGIAPEAERVDRLAVLAALRRCGAVIALFGAVIGGMYAGVFTSTEAAAVGAVGAFVVALARGKLRAASFWSVMAETTQSTALIYGLIFGALAFSFFIGVTALPETATKFIGGLELPHIVVIGLILVLYIVLGSIMDSFAIMFVTVPIVTPLIHGMGYDLLWWGVINLIVVETGMITPPFGLNVFVLKSMLEDVRMSVIFRGVLPFVAADLVKLVLLVLFPALAVWLPSTMR